MIQDSHSTSISQCKLKSINNGTYFSLTLGETSHHLLSDIVPILENLGFWVCSETTLAKSARNKNKNAHP